MDEQTIQMLINQPKLSAIDIYYKDLSLFYFNHV